MTWTTFETASGTAGWHKGDGPRLALVLHGGPGLGDYTESLAEEVLAGGDGALHVVRYQQRGLAPSPTDGPLTVEQLVLDLWSVVDHFESETAVLVGHSWGGHLAMHAAVDAPDRAAALLLVDSLGAVGDGGSGTMDAVIMGRLDDETRAAVAELASSDLSPRELGLATLRLIWPGYYSDPEAAPPMPPIDYGVESGEAIGGDAFRMLAEGVLEAKLRTISVPSLHLIGQHSPIDPAANEATAALMTGSIVEVVDTGHFCWIEQPGVVEAATRRLLGQLP